MTVTLNLTSKVICLLDWEERDTDENISLQADQGIDSASIFYTYGSGYNQVNEAWFKEYTISAGSSQTISLLQLPVTILNMTINKSLSNLKGLFIENTAESGYLTVGNSGISNGVDFMGSQIDIGYSGIYEMNSRSGIAITGTPGTATSSGPNLTTAGTSDASFGTSAWSSPTAIQADDGGFTQTLLATSATPSRYIKGLTYNFAIPTGATITGILLTTKVQGPTLNTITDARVRIVKGGVVGSTDKSSATFWPNVLTARTYGGDGDLWGETWTAADINSANFGAVVSATSNTGITLANMDYMKITIYYTEESGKHNFIIRNPNSIPVTCKVLALGVS